MHPSAFESTAAADALANLAQAMEADRTTVANLATANTNLTNEVANLTSKLSQTDKDIDALSKKIGHLTTAIEKLSIKQGNGGERNPYQPTKTTTMQSSTAGPMVSQGPKTTKVVPAKTQRMVTRRKQHFGTAWAVAQKACDNAGGQAIS
eukprot:3371126-Ditylum_brightwellii.AAC.1